MGLDSMEMKWYVLQAFSGYENKVKQTLEDTIKREGLEDSFGEILVPTEEVLEIKEGQKKRTERKYFPGYVMIKMDLNDNTWHKVKSSPKVLGFVGGTSDKPVPLENSEAENLIKSIHLFKNLLNLNKNKLIFSSTASLYKSSNGSMVTEESELAPQSPYAKTKLAIEMVLEDFANAYGLESIALRYFNPIGADPKMRSGPYFENPTHVVGKLIESTNSKNNIFRITGTDWNTRDGTGIRDYIHVWDLAQAHIAAVEYFDKIVNVFLLIDQERLCLDGSKQFQRHWRSEIQNRNLLSRNC